MRRLILLLFTAATLAACGETQTKTQRDFFTSGNRDADQRAEQRIAQTDQLRGKKGGDNGAAAKKSLYERLGGDQGVAAIVDDFVTRTLADPRVNWERNNLPRGGVLHLGKKPTAWNPTPENLAMLKKHIVQFVAVATGGPAKYEGKDMKAAHTGMAIDNSEFDAAVGDLKATLDKFQIPTDEQKEFLAIVESTRPQIVEKR